MVRVGVRAWLAFLLAAGGAVAGAFALVPERGGVGVFYALRVALGVLQAGTLPACWHVVGVCFPEQATTKPFASCTIGLLLANLVGGPVSAGMLTMDGVAGLHGWQWLFLLQGLPCVLLGALVFALLPADAATARCLSPAQRAALAAAIAAQQHQEQQQEQRYQCQKQQQHRLQHKQRHANGGATPVAAAPQGGPFDEGTPRSGGGGGGGGVDVRRALRRVLADGVVWVAFACAVLVSVPAQTYLLYTPIIVANLLGGTALSGGATVAAAANASALLPAAISAVPYALAVVASYAVAASSQRRDELFGHIVAGMLVSGAVLALFSVAARSAAAGFAALSVSLAANAAVNGPALTLVSRLCRGPGAVVAMPLFASFTVVGGVVGPLLTGGLMEQLVRSEIAPCVRSPSLLPPPCPPFTQVRLSPVPFLNDALTGRLQVDVGDHGADARRRGRARAADARAAGARRAPRRRLLGAPRVARARARGRRRRQRLRRQRDEPAAGGPGRRRRRRRWRRQRRRRCRRQGGAALNRRRRDDAHYSVSDGQRKRRRRRRCRHC